ncbi:MAG: hypothetical protein CMI53_03840 [Parcubacteria group bacterium]|nr:hypothetical protein [Parcubacteria group bacterium]|tara:strand:+ start:5211 stop:6230 length:1020 start_codon:yes stop_codon:yes gene_type:complete
MERRKNKIANKRKSLRQKMNEFVLDLKYLELKLLGKYATTYCYFLPREVQIEVTTICNLMCSWCEVSKRKVKATQQIEMDVIKPLIKSSKGVNSIRFVGVGETLLYKDIVEIVKFSKKYIPNVSVVTNGTFLDKSMIKQLGEAGLSSIAISIDGGDEDMCIRTKGESLHKVLESIKNITELTNIKVDVWSILCKENFESLKKLPGLLKPVGVDRLSFHHLEGSYETTGFHRLEEDSQSVKEFIDYMTIKRNELKINIYLDYLLIKKNNLRIFDMCLHPFSVAVFNVNGLLSQCCMLRSGLKEIDILSLRQAWNSKEMRNFRLNLIKKRYPQSCQACGYK